VIPLLENIPFLFVSNASHLREGNAMQHTEQGFKGSGFPVMITLNSEP
jgi:hypothetical protein